jgi:hypothetical protein
LKLFPVMRHGLNHEIPLAFDSIATPCKIYRPSPIANSKNISMITLQTTSNAECYSSSAALVLFVRKEHGEVRNWKLDNKYKKSAVISERTQYCHLDLKNRGLRMGAPCPSLSICSNNTIQVIQGHCCNQCTLVISYIQLL